MCLAVPGKVVSIDGQSAVVDFGGVQRETNISLVQVRPGDYVVVHAGFAIQTVDEEEAKETIRLWEELMASQEESQA
jgi:hydrogenase expression/formation protein HypC